MAIYQKARPVTWTEVVGQEHVRDVLMSALEKGRIGHAYLFSGPRGVGKTTTARLIAMTVNCESEFKPCGECQSCRLIKSGSHPDVVEIDAASNNSVDDVRDLREKVGLASMRGGKKVYILDEAHMMSRGAFNALLKTLEEPPEHVIFILATTEPEKILPTILSRCQHYRFRRLSEQEIAGKLQRLCDQEAVSYEMGALLLIGRLADGAMRDGESLLERMLSGGEAVTLGAVEMALGLPPGERMLGLARSLLLADAETVLRLAGELYREGFAARTVVEQTKVSLRNLLHAHLGLAGGNHEALEVGQALKLLASLDEQDQRFSRQADLLALEMAFTHAMLSTENAASNSGGGSAQVPPDLMRRLQSLEQSVQQLRQGRPVAAAPVSQGQPAPQESRSANTSSAPQTQAAPPSNGTWHDVLRLADIKMRAFLKPAQASFEGGSLIITISSKFHGAQVISKFDELADLVSKVFGEIPFEVVTPDSSKKKSGKGMMSPPPQQRVEMQPVAQVLQNAPQVQPVPASEPRTQPVPAPIEQASPAPWEAPATPSVSPAAQPQSAPAQPLGRTTQKARGFFEDGPAKKPEPVAPAQATQTAPPAPTRSTSAPVQQPDLPPLPTEHEVLDQAPVFDDLPFPDEDFGAQETQQPQKARKQGSGFQHPLYDTVQQLFPHRVREVGVLKTRAPEEDSEPSEAEPSEE
ncbi:DNA polymerase III subunit gamma/tau [Deinococcus roseus]|uniref:DNA polymerase III subunit gamma/tau n=1 Tax=Deinococcus roseus TaxID=392414 RepID=A0ABQ2CZW4_9DEIO|nr:DNA polymerase III subunit gamma/tau [Deinococcus roseus]GGJ33621.1 hypothetical protein GCM10008938_19850 [Deinococcus roseus]